jgi:hypothetical protein
LELLQGEIAEEIRRKGAQLRGGFAQPVQHGMGIALEDAGGGAET